MGTASAALLALLVAAAACTSEAHTDGTASPPPPPAAARCDPAPEADGVDDPPADAVRIRPGQAWQAVVDAHPPGTTFLAEAGEHRGASAIPRDGDAFLGAPGAVMIGSAVVEGFEPAGATWVAPAPSDLDLGEVGELDPGAEREGRREDLYLDGALLRHVAADAVDDRSWHHDIDRGRIVLGQDPAGHVVEIGRTRHAIEGAGASDVVVRGLTVLRYSPPAQRGAIDVLGSPGWLVEDVVVAGSHAAGVRVGPDLVLRDSALVDNGQIGATGAADVDGDLRTVRLERLEVCGNGRLGFTWAWEKGGIKLVGTADAVIRDNAVHGNDGPGIWMDIDNTDTRIEDNVIEANTITGVLFELSDGLVLSGNRITGNGWAASDDVASGVWVNSSDGAEITGNDLSGNGNEVLITTDERDDRPDRSRATVTGNRITVSTGAVGVTVRGDGSSELLDVERMAFEDNRYVLDGCEPCFLWGGRVSAQAWTALGQDRGSAIELRR